MRKEAVDFQSQPSGNHPPTQKKKKEREREI